MHFRKCTGEMIYQKNAFKHVKYVWKNRKKMMVEKIKMCFKFWELTNTWKKLWFNEGIINLCFRKLKLSYYYLLLGDFNLFFSSLGKWRVWAEWL